MRILLLCLCICLSLFSCKKDDASSGSGSGDIFIRVRNASQDQFDNLVVTSPGGQNKYGTVATGQSSDYKAFSQAYRYAQINLTIQGQTIQLLPIDYVGEPPLQPGRYTYAVDVTTGNPRRLTISLEKP